MALLRLLTTCPCDEQGNRQQKGDLSMAPRPVPSLHRTRVRLKHTHTRTLPGSRRRLQQDSHTANANLAATPTLRAQT
jgi:hypothetical protein